MGATEPPLLFLTGNSFSTRWINRRRVFEGLDPIELVPSFREQLATVKPYKGTRKGDKPFHFDNITGYLLSSYECRVASNGLEADDLICMEQWGRRADQDSVICTRDKDLRMCPGLHFGWECGLQPAFGPELVDTRGWLKRRGDDVKGAGLKFFFYQCLVGDTVDNIPGCPKIGPVKALGLLEGCDTRAEHEAVVRGAYEAFYGNEWQERLEEQAKLLWMVKELNEDGSPKHYDWKF